MSQKSSSTKNKHPKVNFWQYLNNSNEPRDVISHDSPPELETELLENSPAMRRHFRHIARDARIQSALELKSHVAAARDTYSDKQHIKNYAAEMERIDELELSALHDRVTRLKLKFNSERSQQGLLPIV